MSPGDWMISLKDMRDKLPDHPEQFRFHYGLRRGTMKLGLYAPHDQDQQGPHKQDELYIIISGTGDFIKNGERRRFTPQDVIFVEAGGAHHFEAFSADFATWVIFWGPEGGKA
jgi:mannose-6-phosphate isomerase-like protein (cupin superfamily)